MARKIYTKAGAVELIEKSKRGDRFYFYVRFDTPIENDEKMLFQDGACTSVEVSKDRAVKMLEDCLSHVLEARGARIPILVEDAPTYQGRRKTISRFWIG